MGQKHESNKERQNTRELMIEGKIKLFYFVILKLKDNCLKQPQ